MSNRKRKETKYKNKQYSNINTQNANTQKENIRENVKENIKENTQEEVQAGAEETVQKLETKSEESNKTTEVKEAVKPVESPKPDDSAKAARESAKEKAAATVEKTNAGSKAENKIQNKVQTVQKQTVFNKAQNSQTKPKKEPPRRVAVRKEVSAAEFSSENIKTAAVKAAKILLPAAACIIIVAVIISYMGSQKTKAVENTVVSTDAEGAVTLSDEPLAENAYSNVNELMNTFYTALADGDMDTVKALKDYNSDKEIITYEKKSEFIEYYDNVSCYTKAGIEENTYFVYVTYTVKIQNIETKAPGLNAWYVYTTGDGALKIDGDTEENIKAAFKLVTSQDDVVDLYNKIDVSYKEAVASDEMLSAFMDELPVYIKTSVGEALAQLETQDENSSDTPQTETQASGEEPQTQTSEAAPAGEGDEMPQNQVVNQIVRATDTVNVRSSDSEEADRIGKAQAGTELTRVEDRVNGWSKVIFEGREAYIKSDYLEVVTTEAVAEPIGKITALTNVNVRSQANQESAKLGTAQAGNSYDLLEDLGEWYKINYNGNTGFVKAEFFEK